MIVSSLKTKDVLDGGIINIKDPAERLKEAFREFPVIASLCREEDIGELEISNVKLAYIMCGGFNILPEIINRVKKAGISPIVYLDFINGLSAREGAVDFVKYYTDAEAILTTRSNQVNRAHDLGMYAIQRYFVYDIFSLSTLRTQIASSKADMIEILPGVVLDAIKYLSERIDKPLMVGGFVNNQERLEAAMRAGAVGTSSSLQKMWHQLG